MCCSVLVQLNLRLRRKAADNMRIRKTHLARSIMIGSCVAVAIGVSAVVVAFIVDRRIQVAFHVPRAYHGFFVVVVTSSNVRDSSPVSVTGSWRNRQYVITVPNDGIVLLSDDHFLQTWHRSRAREAEVAGEQMISVPSGDDDIFFSEEDMVTRDSGLREYWMFYGNHDDYRRQRHLRELEHRIAEIEKHD